jgi:MFS family permease
VGPWVLINAPWYYALAPMQPTAIRYALFSGCGTFFVLGAGITMQVSLQHLVPPRMRGAFVGFFLLSVSLIGLGVGPPLAASISTMLASDGTRLGLAMVFAAPAICLPGLLFIALSLRGVARVPGDATV